MKTLTNKLFAAAVSSWLLVSAQADTLVGTYNVNYRYNAAGQYTDQGNPNYTSANPYYGNAIPPGPVFINAAPGHYKLVVVSGPGCCAWSGDASSGTFLVTGHNPSEIVEFDHAFGQIALYYWDWVAYDNDPNVQTTISVYQVDQNDAPVAIDQAITTDQDTPVSVTLTASDADSDPLIFQVVTLPSHGALSGTPPNLTYTPNDCYTGQDSFTFKVNDDQADSGIATVGISINPCTPSGPELMALFPGSNSTDDLAEPFRSNVNRFLAALAAATDARGNPNPAHVSISETLRTPARAYLMHYAYLIARQDLDPATVPQPDEALGLGCIGWLHKDSSCNPDLTASVDAAAQMLCVAAPRGIATAPAYPSNHQIGNAIDMTIRWRGTLVIQDGNGRRVRIKSGARNGACNGANNPQLWAVGASYGVTKLPSDSPHWSLDGH